MDTARAESLRTGTRVVEILDFDGMRAQDVIGRLGSAVQLLTLGKEYDHAARTVCVNISPGVGNLWGVLRRACPWVDRVPLEFYENDPVFSGRVVLVPSAVAPL